MTKDYAAIMIDQNHLLELNTKLWFAVANNHPINKIQELLDQNATLHKLSGQSLRKYDSEENTPLHIAAKNGFLKIVQLLLECGMNPDIRNRSKQTSLQWAAYHGHIEIVKLLIDCGADINSLDADGDPALTWAANQGQGEIVDYLVKQGADPAMISSLGNTALHWTAISGEAAMAKHLIELGCDPSLKNIQGYTPLDLGIENAHPEIVNLLLRYSNK